MAISWPTQLQDKLSSDNFTYNIGETKIRSDMDIGPAKVRRRFTRAIDTLNCSIQLKYQDFLILRNFHEVTLNGGVNEFEYEHPFTHEMAVFRMVVPPSMSPIGSGGVMFNVSMQWELMDNG